MKLGIILMVLGNMMLILILITYYWHEEQLAKQGLQQCVVESRTIWQKECK